MILLLAMGCADGRDPVLLSINDAVYDYDVTGALRSYGGVNVVPGQTLPLKLRVRHTAEIHFANLPGLVTFDPTGTEGTLEVFGLAVDTGYGGIPEAIVTLTSPTGRSRDFPFSWSFPRDTADTGGRDEP
ncbi:MAG: hypothetical protein R3F59_19105 [Myxococcota bacterium]